MSWPPMLTLPAEGGMKPVIMRMVVDLPAPLGPRKPSTSPRSTVKEMPSTARFAPKAFTRLSILIIEAAGLRDGRLKIEARFSHKPKDETYADVREIARRPFCRRGGRAAGAGAELPRQAGAHHRAVRARRRVGLHRPLHRAAPDRFVRQAGDRREQAR